MNLLYNFRNIIVYSGQEPAAYKMVEDDINEGNRRSTVAFGCIAAAMLAVMTLMSFFDESLIANRGIYLFCAVSMCIISALSYTKARSNKLLANILMYLFLTLLLILGIIIGTVTIPEEKTTTFIAFLLAVPQFLNKKPYKIFILNMCAVAIFIVMVILNKDPSTWDSDIVNSVAFGILGCIVGTYTSMINTRRFYLENTIRHMAETDQLTGLKNRNSYEATLRNADILKVKSISCVYVDVNGLHELNNTRGHEAGDRMLQYIATVMQNIFGIDDAYRIGGDEFVAFGYDKSEETVDIMVQRMKQAVEGAGYSIAVGVQFEEHDQTKADEIVKNAEIKMYEDKRRFYDEQGLEHHRRRY